MAAASASRADAVVVGFIVTFVIGGMTGVLWQCRPPFQLHNSLFLVAHFHNVIIGGVLFAGLAGLTYWFPKAFWFSTARRLGQAAFWLSLVGFYVTFVLLYVAGLLGMTRRAALRARHGGPVLIAGLGIVIMICAAACQVAQLAVSIRRREECAMRPAIPGTAAR
jgi:cytochrome o ubiquinol oxidase subunit 1